MSAVLVSSLTPGQLCAARPNVGYAQAGEVVTVLETLPGDRVRVAYGTVTDLVVPVVTLAPLPPSARSTDPGTSHMAAARATVPMKLYAGQRRALHAIVAAGQRGLNDFELADRTGSKQTSIGVRRGELARAGLVTRSGRRRPSDTGEPADVWIATDLGIDVWRQTSDRETA